MNTIFPKYFKHSLIRLVSIVTILSFVLSNIAFALPASPSGGPDTLRPKQPLQQRPAVVQGLGDELLKGAGTRGADKGYITKGEHASLRLWLKEVKARSEENRRRDLEEQFGVKGKVEIYQVPNLYEEYGRRKIRGHWAVRDGIVYVDKFTLVDRETLKDTPKGLAVIKHDTDELDGMLTYAALRRWTREQLAQWLDETGDELEVTNVLLDIHNRAAKLSDGVVELIPDRPSYRRTGILVNQPGVSFVVPPDKWGRPVRGAAGAAATTDLLKEALLNLGSGYAVSGLAPYNPLLARISRAITYAALLQNEPTNTEYKEALLNLGSGYADSGLAPYNPLLNKISMVIVYTAIIRSSLPSNELTVVTSHSTPSRGAEYFIGGLQVNWDIWEFVPGNPNQIWQKVDHSVRAQRGPNGFEMFGGGLAAGTGESEQPLDTPQQMRLAEGETDFAKELRGDVLPQAPAPDIKSMVDEAIKQADQAAQAVKSAPKAPATGAITLSPADDEPQLFVGSTGDEEFEPFHSAVFKAQEIYEQGGKTQEAARKASEALISYLIKMHNMDYPVNLDYAIFILKNAGNPDLLPIVAVLEEFQAGPKDDAGELLANLKAAIIDSLQEELRGLREQELTLSRTDEVVLRIPTYLRREELDKIGQRREEINAQLERLTAASFLKAIDNWQMSEEWPGISVKDKGVQTYVVNLPYDYSEPEVLLTSLRAELGAGVNIVVRLRGADEKTFSYYRKFNLGLDLKLGIEAIEQVDENMLSQALRGIEVKPGEKHLFIIEKENYSGLKSEEAILSNMQQVNANLKVALVQKTDLAQPTDASRRILNLLFGPKQVDVITPETITGEDLRQELTTALAALRKA